MDASLYIAHAYRGDRNPNANPLILGKSYVVCEAEEWVGGRVTFAESCVAEQNYIKSMVKPVYVFNRAIAFPTVDPTKDALQATRPFGVMRLTPQEASFTQLHPRTFFTADVLLLSGFLGSVTCPLDHTELTSAGTMLEYVHTSLRSISNMQM